jgi:hypothetical protein
MATTILVTKSPTKRKQSSPKLISKLKATQLWNHGKLLINTLLLIKLPTTEVTCSKLVSVWPFLPLTFSLTKMLPNIPFVKSTRLSSELLRSSRKLTLLSMDFSDPGKKLSPQLKIYLSMECFMILTHLVNTINTPINSTS